MKRATDLLNDVGAKMGWETDYQLAKGLRTSKQAISKIRNGGGLGNELAFRIAEILGEDPAMVIIEAEAERAEKAGDFEKVRQWERRFQALSQHVPGLSFFAIALSYGQEVFHKFCILC